MLNCQLHEVVSSEMVKSDFGEEEIILLALNNLSPLCLLIAMKPVQYIIIHI